MTAEVDVEFIDGIVVITINRPEASNSVNRAVAEGISEALQEPDGRDDLTVGVITGAGRTFRAGMDLKAFLAGENRIVRGKGSPGSPSPRPRNR